MARGLNLLLPGLTLLRRGMRAEGIGVMILWLWLVSVLVTRFPRAIGAVSGGVGDRIALLALLGSLAVLWGCFGFGSGRRSPTSGEGPGMPGGFWARFRENRMALMGLAVVVACVMAALLAPFVAPFDPVHQPAFSGGGELGLRLLSPSWEHLLGTDQYSRDIFSRILYGARISLGIGFLAVAVSVSLGTLLGVVAGYLGGWVDVAVMRFVDMVMAFPRIVLLIVLVALFQPSIFLIVTALALTQWPSTTRLVRGEVLSLREREFAEAARALGFSTPRIIFRHILPNALPPVIVAASLGIGNTIVLEAGLSFLGLGAQPPTPSWGIMVSDGRNYLLDAWWIATFPGLAIVLVVLALNLMGDGLRDALDPRQEGRSW